MALQDTRYELLVLCALQNVADIELELGNSCA